MKNTKTKSAIILSVTLIIGFLVGFYINSVLVQSKFDKFTKMRKPGGLEEMMLEQLNPTDEQRPVIKEILQNFKIRMDALREKSFVDLDNLKDSLFAELKPLLTEEQFKRMSERFFNRDRKFGPPGEMREGGPMPPMDMMERRQDGSHDGRPMPPNMQNPNDRPMPRDRENPNDRPMPPDIDKE